MLSRLGDWEFGGGGHSLSSFLNPKLVACFQGVCPKKSGTKAISLVYTHPQLFMGVKPLPGGGGIL